MHYKTANSHHGSAYSHCHCQMEKHSSLLQSCQFFKFANDDMLQTSTCAKSLLPSLLLSAFCLIPFPFVRTSFIDGPKLYTGSRQHHRMVADLIQPTLCTTICTSYQSRDLRYSAHHQDLRCQIALIMTWWRHAECLSQHCRSNASVLLRSVCTTSVRCLPDLQGNTSGSAKCIHIQDTNVNISSRIYAQFPHDTDHQCRLWSVKHSVCMQHAEQIPERTRRAANLSIWSATDDKSHCKVTYVTCHFFNTYHITT